MVALWCRGRTKNCPKAISDFVLLHNKAAEGLAKHDHVGYDIYSGIADTKALFLKNCKPYEKRIRSMEPTHCVVPAGDGEDPTTVSIPGYLVGAKAKGKKAFAPMKVVMPFLEHHRNLYLDLHREFSKGDYAQQSEASLQNFQTLLIMELGLLMGNDIDWGSVNPKSAAGGNAGVDVIPPAGNDDSDNSDEPTDDDAPAPAPAPAPADAVRVAAATGGGGEGDAGGGGAADAAGPRSSSPAAAAATPESVSWNCKIMCVILLVSIVSLILQSLCYVGRFPAKYERFCAVYVANHLKTRNRRNGIVADVDDTTDLGATIVVAPGQMPGGFLPSPDADCLPF